jgi:uncharacterized RDD family membrane protein YckC
MARTAPDIVFDQHAGFASRLAAFAVDLAIINFTLILCTAAVGTVLRYFNFDNIFNIGEEPTTLGRIIVSVVGAVSFLVTYFGYPVFFWVMIGQTPGKRLLGLRVIQTDGQLLGVGRAVLRVFGYWISTIALFFGFAWILFDGQRQGWHDKIAGTYVIYYRPESKRPLQAGGTV